MENNSLPYVAVELDMCVTAVELMSSSPSLEWPLAYTPTDLQRVIHTHTHTYEVDNMDHSELSVAGGNKGLQTLNCVCACVCRGLMGMGAFVH